VKKAKVATFLKYTNFTAITHLFIAIIINQPLHYLTKNE